MVFSMGTFVHAENFSAGSSGSSKILVSEDTTGIFADVPIDHWAFDEIQFFYNAGIVAGINDNTFEPDRNVSREEFAKLLAVIFSRTQTISTEQTFSDVTPEMWSYNYIEGVKEFLTGYYPTGTQPFFNPQGKAVREDIAYSLVKIIGLDKEGLKDKAVFDKFRDSDDISPSIKDFVGIAMENGLIKGYEDNTFRPNQGITRAEAVVLLFRALKAPVETTPTASPEQTADPTPIPSEPSPVPTTTPKPTPVPSPKSDYQYSLSSDNIERISGYSDNNVKGSISLEWSPSANKAKFVAKLKVSNNPLDVMDCNITLVELTSCTDDTITGYFKMMLFDKVMEEKIKGSIHINGKKLTLTTKEHDYNLVVTHCEIIENNQLNKELPSEKPKKEETGDEEIWYDAKSVYSSKPGFFKGEGVDGEISGFASIDFSVYEKAVRFRAEVNAETITDGVKKFKITLTDTKSFSDSEIIGTFKIICNDKIVEKNISGRITNVDGGLNEKMLFQTDDSKWSLEMIIVERVL